MGIGDRIKARRSELGLSAEALGAQIGKAKTTIYRYETGVIENLPSSVLEPIAKALATTPAYLMGWTNDPQAVLHETAWPSLTNDPQAVLHETAWPSLKNDPQPRDEVALPANIRPITRKRFPMLGDIACGKPIFAEEEHNSYIDASDSINADFCLLAKGDSMIGARIHDGDVVFIRRQEIVDNGEIAAVIIGDEATLKRWYYYPEDGKLMLVAENSKYPPLVYMGEELDHVVCLGKAVCFMSSL